MASRVEALEISRKKREAESRHKRERRRSSCTDMNSLRDQCPDLEVDEAGIRESLVQHESTVFALINAEEERDMKAIREAEEYLCAVKALFEEKHKYLEQEEATIRIGTQRDFTEELTGELTTMELIARLRAETKQREREEAEERKSVAVKRKQILSVRRGRERAFSEKKTSYTGTENILIVMRHSVRCDTTFGGFANVPQSMWPDKLKRPYDPPITDVDLPVCAAKMMKKFKVQVIVSSPYRRCLQTAGIVARTLAVSVVHVDDRLGEWYREVVRCSRDAGMKPPIHMQRLTEKQVEKELGYGVSLGNWKKADIGESDTAGLLPRVATTVPSLAKKYSRQNVLLVTHGDIANRYLPEATFIEEYSYLKLHEAGYVALKAPHSTRSTEDAILEQFRSEHM
ncbi:hypothetical protein DIPPA_35644 [Diplonema papillatum]|nr:hypothetical protein DIPPA_35644 [Diplonema papillatum]